MKTKNKSGFTLLEMLIVVGIIGTLLGMVLFQFTGATESAKAAQCESNLRNLVTAAHSCAQTAANGEFPVAASFWYTYVSHKDAGVVYPRRLAWISGREVSSPGDREKVEFDPIPFNEDKKPEMKGSAYWAVTNGCGGAMWKAMHESSSGYLCPIHSAAVRKATKNLPGWSYVMNREFGYQDKRRNGTWWGQSLNSMSIRKSDGGEFKPDHSKVLMFAELQGIEIDLAGYDHVKPNLTARNTKADAVLDYEDNESIGFNHKTDKRKISGHAAFADGHVERIHCPKSGSSLNRLKLTRALCRGHEVIYNGKTGGYEDKTESDN